MATQVDHAFQNKGTCIHVLVKICSEYKGE